MARKKGPFDAVQFTRESAERIAGVVRQAELTPPSAAPLTFERYVEGRVPKQVRAATFSGSWPIGGTKTVTFKYAPTATATVMNLSWPITSTGYVNEDCIVGREGTSWWLVVPKLEARTAVFVTQTQSRTIASGFSDTQYAVGVVSFTVVSGINVQATLNTTDCSIVVDTTVSTATIQGVTGTAIGKFVTGTTTAAFIASAATATYLRVRVP